MFIKFYSEIFQTKILNPPSEKSRRTFSISVRTQTVMFHIRKLFMMSTISTTRSHSDASSERFEPDLGIGIGIKRVITDAFENRNRNRFFYFLKIGIVFFFFPTIPSPGLNTGPHDFKRK